MTILAGSRMKTKKGAEEFRAFLFSGTPGRIRTCDLQLRRLTPYPLGYGRKWRPKYRFPDNYLGCVIGQSSGRRTKKYVLLKDLPLALPKY